MSIPCPQDMPARSDAIAPIAPPGEALLLAQRLHDELAQLLALALVQLDLAHGSEREQATKASTRARQLVQLALCAVRRTIGQLQPPPTAELTAALAESVNELSQQYGTRIGFTHYGPATTVIPFGVVAALISAATELLRNACKHAAGAVPQLLLVRNEQRLEMLVSDQGPGFDPLVTLPASAGQGLRLLHDRLATEGLRLELRSAPGEGVQARVVWLAAPRQA